MYCGMMVKTPYFQKIDLNDYTEINKLYKKRDESTKNCNTGKGKQKI